jgi:hypothetical protein
MRWPDRDVGTGGGNGDGDGGDLGAVDGNFGLAGWGFAAVVVAGNVDGPTGCVDAIVKLGVGDGILDWDCGWCRPLVPVPYPKSPFQNSVGGLLYRHQMLKERLPWRLTM